MVKNLTAKEISKLCGVTIQTANNWLSGRVRMPKLAIEAIKQEELRRFGEMVEKKKSELRKLELETLLKRRDYRLRDGVWMRSIGGNGAVLNDWEAEINRRGGIDCGSDPIAIIKKEIADLTGVIDGATRDEIDDNPELRAIQNWLNDATATLPSPRPR